METTGLYQLTAEQKELVRELQSIYNGNIKEFIDDLKYKIEHQYERPKKSKKMKRKYSAATIKNIQHDLPKIEELKRIADDLKQIDPAASLADLL